MAETFGIGHVYSKRVAAPRKPQWTWEIQGPSVLTLIELIYPFLKMARRRQHIDDLLAEQGAPHLDGSVPDAIASGRRTI